MTIAQEHPPLVAPRPSRRSRIAAAWAAMDLPGRGRRIPGTGAVTLVAMLVQAVVAWFSVGSGAALWYSDAMSHLTIAGRISSGFNAGVQQLGTVWLPAPHLITAPLAANHWLWSTGWAAAIIGIIAMGVSAAALYRICARVGLGRTGRLVAVAALVANPSILYAYTTALTEPVLLAALFACIAGLAHYATAVRPLSGGELAVFAGLPAAVAALTRYEGWVVVLSGVLFIAIVEWRTRRRSGWRALVRGLVFAIPPLLAMTVVPMLAISWWLGYNFVNFGDALEFVFGQYSAFAQQERIAEFGTLTTQGDIAVSLTVICGAVWQIATPVLVCLGLVGAAWLVAIQGLGTRVLIAAVLLSPFVFNVVALYLGQTTMRNDFSAPPGLFNVRYAMTAIPFLAFCVGVLGDALTAGAIGRAIGRARVLVLPALLAALLVQGGAIATDLVARSPVVGEGALNQQIRSAADPVWEYLEANYDGTGILVDEVTNVLRPQAGIPLGDYYILAAGNHFEEALARPTRHVGWIMVNTADLSRSYHTDAVWDAMQAFPENYTAYRQVLQAEHYALYRLVER